MRTSSLLLISVSALLLAGCGTANKQTAQSAWQAQRSPELGASLLRPSFVEPGAVEHKQLQVGDSTIEADELPFTRTDGSDAGGIHLLRTEDPKILTLLAVNASAEGITVGNKSFQRFSRTDRPGEDYVINQGTWYYVVSFDYQPVEGEADIVLRSLQFDQ